MPDNESNRMIIERPAPRHFRIFLSSPSDVWEERSLARKLIQEKLPYRPFLHDRITFDVVSWDDPHA